MKHGLLIWAVLLTLNLEAEGHRQLDFRLVDGWAIVVEGRLGTSSGQKMLVDTGAVPSVIDNRLAKKMGLSGHPVAFSILNQTIGAESVRVPVQVGPVLIEALDMVTVDLTQISRALGIRIDAIVGLDLLGRQNFSIDYRHQRLEFGGSITEAETLPFEMGQEADGTYIVIAVETDGEKMRMLFDTGTKDLMLFQSHLRGGLRKLRPRGAELNVNAGGEDRIFEVELVSLSIGAVTLKRQKAYIWAASGGRDKAFDGLLGAVALKPARVQFDFERRIIAFGH
jgi:predicted aspartyl protease